eukprot:10897053-Lingulodinium_polyedra.AAC.1
MGWLPGGLASMARVAKDAINRTRAEFHSADLNSAYPAFDVDQWYSICSVSTLEAALPGRLRNAGRKLRIVFQ